MRDKNNAPFGTQDDELLDDDFLLGLPQEDEELPDPETLFPLLDEADVDDDLPFPTAPKKTPAASKDAEQSKAAPKAQKSPGQWFSRLQGAALDLSDQILDWRDDMTYRFQDMASDPENDSIAAKMIRRSGEIVSGIEDQQRETDQQMEDIAAARGGERLQQKPDVLTPEGDRPRFVFYNMDEAPSGTQAGTPIQLEHPTLIDDQGQVISPAQPSIPSQDKPKAETKPKPSAPKSEPARPKKASAPPKANKPAAPAQPVKAKASAEADEDLPFAAAASKRANRPPQPPKAGAGESATSGSYKPVLRLARRVQYVLFFLFLGIFALMGLLAPLRADFSSLEARALTEKPGISAAGLWSGSYFAQRDQWFDDTYPGRERLAGLYAGIGAILGSGSDASSESDTQDEAEPTPSETIVATAPAIDAVLPTESAASETSPTAETATATGSTTDTTK